MTIRVITNSIKLKIHITQAGLGCLTTKFLALCELNSVRCSLHGEIARFDVSDGIGMLCPAWDVAVVEYHNRWERRWDDTYDTPDYDGCRVRIEPTVNPASANLLDVEEMWIVTEGGSRPWWPYVVIPRHKAEED